MPPRSQKHPQDVTGRLAEQRAAEHAEELAERSRQMSLINAQRAIEEETTVVDLTGSRPVSVPADAVELQMSDVEVKDAYVTIRTNCDLEQVTIGKGTSYDFVRGRKYRVPRDVAEHLEEKGLLWH